jgi:AcrR family transcriptional regulator
VIGDPFDVVVVQERRTQVERTAESRHRLVDAAIKFLAEQGYAGATLAEIGREAGLSRGLVSHHFGTKEACMEAVIVTIRERISARVRRAIAGLRGLAALDSVIDVYFEQLRGQDAGVRAMYTVLTEAITAAQTLRQATAKNNEEFWDLVAGCIVEAIEDGEVSDQVVPQVSAILVEGIVRGVATQWLIAPDRVDLGDVVEELKHAAHRSMTAPREPRPPAKRGSRRAK